MKLATLRHDGGLAAVRVEGDSAVLLCAGDVGAVLREPDWLAWAKAASGPALPLAGLEFAAPVTRPAKVICVGLNYRSHIEESGAEVPQYPTLFTKFASSLTGPCDQLALPAESDQVDWEAELGLVIGSAVRHATPAQAQAAIAGYTVLNDVSVRDWQMRTTQWLAGKAFDALTPVGPWLVTAEEFGAGRHRITCEVDGEIVQDGDTADLVFGPAELVAYISAFTTLEPGDVIATGTPGGVGTSRTPPRYLRDGAVLVTRIEGIGELRNVCRAPAAGA